jgi:hypothetical protein
VDADGNVHHLASADRPETLRSAVAVAAAQFPNRDIRVRQGDNILSTIDLALLWPRALRAGNGAV